MSVDANIRGKNNVVRIGISSVSKEEKSRILEILESKREGNELFKTEEGSYIWRSEKEKTRSGRLRRRRPGRRRTRRQRRIK